MKKTILKAEGLCKSYAHNGGQIHILGNLDISIYEGDFTVVMGASGSGKSTLLYMLSGMDSATSGKVFLGETELTSATEKQLARIRHSETGFIFQQMHLVSNLSLLENVCIPGYLAKKYSAAQVKRRAAELLERMGLTDAAKLLPSQVSGGEQQRCAVARALINEPRIIFADEPTGSLNKSNSTDVLDLLTELNRSGISILMVTHDMRAALRGSRLLYLEDGDIIGGLETGEFSPETEKRREAQVNAWLSALKW